MAGDNLKKLLDSIDLSDIPGMSKVSDFKGKPFAKPCNPVQIYRKNLPSFKEIWIKYVKPLEGKRIILNNGKDQNLILAVNDEGVERISREGNPSLTPIKAYEYAYDTMLNSSKGTVKRQDILDAFHSDLCSSIVVAILGQYVPFISTIEVAVGLRLNLKRK